MCLTGQMPRINATEICIKKKNKKKSAFRSGKTIAKICSKKLLSQQSCYECTELLLSQSVLFLRGLFSAFWSLSECLTFVELWEKKLLCSLTKRGQLLLGFPRKKAHCYMCCC